MDTGGDSAIGVDQRYQDLAPRDSSAIDSWQFDAVQLDAATADRLADAATADSSGADRAVADSSSVDATFTDLTAGDARVADSAVGDAGQRDAAVADSGPRDLGAVDACQPTGPESTANRNCEDGIDNDCDGLTDEHDDACWWDQGWTQRRKLTFDNAARDTALDDFPVLLVLSSSRIDFAKTRNTGEDLRFVAADNQVVLAHQIERYQEPNPAQVWVRVPHIAARSSSDHIWMYYGSTASNGEQPAQVWSNGFQAVYHCANNLDDSTANAFNGADHGTTNLVAGQIAQSRTLNGSNQWVGLGGNRNWLRNTSAATLSAWIRPSATDGDRSVIAISINNGSTATGVSRAYIETFNGYVSIGGRASDADSERRIISDNSAIAAGAWHYVAGVIDYASGRGTIFVDGWQIYDGALDFDQTVTANTSATNGAIGAQDDGSSYYFGGNLDEVRIATALRSAAWISAEFQSQSDNGFVLYGVEQIH